MLLCKFYIYIYIYSHFDMILIRFNVQKHGSPVFNHGKALILLYAAWKSLFLLNELVLANDTREQEHHGMKWDKTYRCRGERKLGDSD